MTWVEQEEEGGAGKGGERKGGWRSSGEELSGQAAKLKSIQLPCGRHFLPLAKDNFPSAPSSTTGPTNTHTFLHKKESTQSR